LLSKKREQKLREENRGGSNKQTILLTVDCAMEICLLVNTIRGKQVRHYYMKIEKIMKNDIKLKFEEQQKQITDQQKIVQEQANKIKLFEEADKKQNYYIFKVSEDKWKLGITNDLERTLQTYRRNSTQTSFYWTYEFKTENKHTVFC